MSEGAELGALIRAVQRLTLPDAATAWMRLGHPVFPIVPGRKEPLTEHGYRDASTDAAQIAEWWRAFPTANIGLATGRSVDVLDIDRHGSGSGFAALAAPDRANVTDGWIAAVATPNRGLHLYYPAAGDARSWSAGRTQVDFRGTGGYVLVPPSRLLAGGGTRGYRLVQTRSGGRVLDSAHLKEILRPAPLARPAPSSEGGVVTGADMRRITGWLRAQPEGNRNHGLFWAACRLAEHAISSATALELLGPAATATGLEEREIVATIRSAYRTTGPAATTTTPVATTQPRQAAPPAR